MLNFDIMRYTILIITMFSAFWGWSQTEDQNTSDKLPELIQFSGVVVDDSLGGVPYAYIYEKNSRNGTMTDYHGYFSFVAEKGDTIVFSSISHKDNYLVIPDTLSSDRYSIIQLLNLDIKQLQAYEVYPWPSKEQFLDAFLELELSGNDFTVAQRNLKRQELMAQVQGVSNDSYLSFKDQSRQQHQKLYNSGQAPSINLLNPVAWSKFIQSWKNGDLKRQ